MNKYLFIFGFAGMALFSACSTSDDLTAEEPHVTPPVEETKEAALIVEASKNSDVPINLGVGDSRGITRAPIGDESDDPDSEPVAFTTSEPGRYLGVFCLATGKQSGVSDIPEDVKSIYWTDDDQGQLGGLLVRMNNVPAKVGLSGVQFLDVDALPTETSKKYYYPVMNWMKYNFYAYYPYDPQENNVNLIFESARRLRMEYEIDGSQDLIWGIANPVNVGNPADSESYADPYSAKYFRWRETHLDEHPINYWYPNMSFKHKLVQFKFSVKPADEDKDLNGTPDVVDAGAKVTDMYISNAINKLDLIVANEKPEPHPAGTDSGDMTYSGNTLPTTSLGIKGNSSNNNRFDQNGDGVLDNPLTLTTSEQEVGYILLPSPAIANDANFKYRLVVNLDFNGDSSVAYIDMDGSFDAGKIYDITVIVKSPMEISANAVLQPWDNTPTATPIEYNVGD